MTDKEFWELVEATEEEKKKGFYYLRERGLEEHFKVLRFLEARRESNDKRVTYREIASVLRYDKRIRRCLFKYIGVVEERLRAHFMDYCRDDITKLRKTAVFNFYYKRKGNDLYKTITHLTFHPLIMLFNKQDKEFQKSVFGEVENLRQNLHALAFFRNQVFHNKFLLDNLGLGQCKYDGVKKSSLNANIKNLYYFSEAACGKNMIYEIEACAYGENSKKYENQVDWDLPECAVLSFDKGLLFKKGYLKRQNYVS